MKGEVTQTQEHKLTSNSILKFSISRMCFTRVNGLLKNVHLRNQSVIKNNTFAVVESIHVCLHHITIQVSTHLLIHKPKNRLLQTGKQERHLGDSNMPRERTDNKKVAGHYLQHMP